MGSYLHISTWEPSSTTCPGGIPKNLEASPAIACRVMNNGSRHLGRSGLSEATKASRFRKYDTAMGSTAGRRFVLMILVKGYELAQTITSPK